LTTWWLVHWLLQLHHVGHVGDNKKTLTELG